VLTYGYGDIVLFSAVLDPQGGNPKDRPAMVVTPEEAIEQGQPIEVVAITTLIPDPLPDDHVLLPWQLPRHPRTGLNKRCAAVGSWLASIPQDRVIRIVGFAPARRLVELAVILDRLKKQREEHEHK
jgi:mRNA-degrading endonuclease toxin of MazEF toxin-antitoxin module